MASNGSTAHDVWYYPSEIENDLKGVDLPDDFIPEALACGWEYTRCVIPHFTSWKRYVAFIRLMVLAVIADFRGELVDVAGSDIIAGYETVFAGTAGHKEMVREFRCFLLGAAEKSSNRRDSEFFRRYVNALAQSPKNWFRIRDCDILARISMAGAVACNDFDNMWFSEDEWELLSELGICLYDGVAFYKHRAEGETHSTFAYVSSNLRYRRCREVLWALDVKWARDPGRRCVVNCLRYASGPMHMMMRRYRFVEDDLTIGNPETERVVAQTRQIVKLWYRVDTTDETSLHSARYADIIARRDKLMFAGLAEMLQSSDDGHCDRCVYRLSYGAEAVGQFGGVKLCDGCKEAWGKYIESFSARAAEVFPVVKSVLAIR